MKSRYFGIQQLKSIRADIEYIGSTGLKNALDDYIQSSEQGDYLMNILNNSQIWELEQLSKDWMIEQLLP